MYSYCCLCILIVRPYILNVVYVFLLLSIYSYYLSMYSYCCLCILVVVHVFLDEATLTSALNQCTVQPFTESDDTRCCVNTIFPSEDGHVNARNMSRIIV